MIGANPEMPAAVATRHMGGRLPLELVDQIIGFAAEDTSSLRASALTCHCWNAIIRCYMFRRVDIINEKRLQALEDVLQAAPHLDNHIRELSIGPFSPQGHRESSRWVVRVPEHLPLFLTKVRTIRFIRLSDAGEFCDSEFFAMFYYFLSVTRLVLEDCAMNISVLQAFASSLPNLTELIITDMLPLMVTLWEAPPQLSSPRLTALVIDIAKTASPTMSNFLDWLLSTDSLNTLRSADFGFTILDAKVVKRSLLDIGPRLQHLGLHVKSMFESSEWEQELIHREVDIGICTNLSSLTIDLKTAQSAASFLKDVKAKDIRVLSFRILMKDGYPQPDFESLTHILNDGTFCRVERVRFIHTEDLAMYKVEEALRKSLPDLYTRGLLRVLDGRRGHR
ncbi:hypothetical protein BC835DRAFT_530101 [Cytidiella melzeri]|nr:hypothetical protein BC835DRAFT_530101 [Cytidiella melzeri]